MYFNTPKLQNPWKIWSQFGWGGGEKLKSLVFWHITSQITHLRKKLPDKSCRVLKNEHFCFFDFFHKRLWEGDKVFRKKIFEILQLTRIILNFLKGYVEKFVKLVQTKVAECLKTNIFISFIFFISGHGTELWWKE